MTVTRSEQQRANEQLAELHTELAEAVERLAGAGGWKALLDVAARFHTYSANNTILIWSQRPDASLVAGYRTWQQAGRQVCTGERGIRIFAPIMKTLQPEQDDVEAGPPGEPDAWRPNRERVMVGVRRAHVWDVAQTTGEPLPHPSRAELLEGEVPDDLWEGLVDQVASSGYELRRGVCRQPRAKGHTDFTLRTVTIRPDLTGAQAAKTLAHELGHIALHDPIATGRPLPTCRGLVEVEADSVAYLVAKAHGLDTGTYSFAYITGWAASRNLASDPAKVVQQTATRVLHAARNILNQLGYQPIRLDLERPTVERASATPSAHATRASLAPRRLPRRVHTSSMPPARPQIGNEATSPSL